MKVLLVTPMPPDPRAASAIPLLLHAQLVGLQRRHEITLVTVAGPEPDEIEAVERLRTQGVEVHSAVRTLTRGKLGWRRRLRIVSTWLGGRVPLRTAWFAEPAIQSTIEALVAERKPDVILVEDNAMATFDLPRGLPTILTEHEVRRPRRIERPPRSPRGWPKWALMEADWRRWPSYQRRVWSRFDALQVFAHRDAAAVAAMAPALADRVRVNPFAIELPSPDDMKEKPNTMLFAGNYSHPPNVDAALWLAQEILPCVARLNPEVELSIVGPHAPPEIRGLDGRGVRFLGRLPDIDALMRRTAVVMAPVRTGGGMRMKVLQAMAFGKPVVTTPRGAEGLINESTALPLKVAEDAEGLACAAAGLLQDPGARHDLGRRARRYVEANHSPEAYAKRVDRILVEVTAAAKVHRRPVR